MKGVRPDGGLKRKRITQGLSAPFPSGEGI
jgi:hypothetical protein